MISTKKSQLSKLCLRLAGLLFTSLFSQPILAQAFDCSKALISQEKSICASTELRAADVRLNGLYQAVLLISKTKKSAIQQQKDWLNNVRGKCSEVQCLADSYATRSDQLLTALRQCKVEKNKIENNWVRVGDGGFFEELSIDPDGSVSSWIHERPEMSGTWTIDGCLVDIRSSSMAIEWVITSVKPKRLAIYEIGSGAATYRASQ